MGWGKLVEAWNWQPAGLAPFDRARERLLARMLLVLAALSAATVPAELVLPGPKVTAVFPVIFSVFSVACLALLRAGRGVLAANLFVGGNTLMLGGMLLALGGIRSAVPPFFGTVAMLAAVYLKPRYAAVAVLVDIGIVIASVWIPGLGLPQVPIPDGGPIVTQCIAIVDVAVLGGFAFDALDAISAEAERRTGESLASAAKAQAAIEAKARFLATMSHELRTPLNAILGYAGLLGEETPNDPDLVRLDSAGRLLLARVEDLLDLARAEASPPRRDPLDVVEVVRATVGPGTPVVAPDVVTLSTDRRILARIAATVGRGAGRVIRVDDEPDAVIVRVEVTELDPHSPVDGDSAWLGVSLCQRLARQLGGTFAAEIRPDGGSYALTLPRGI